LKLTFLWRSINLKWWNSFTCLQWWNHRVLINIESALNSRLFLTWSALSLTKKQPYKSGKIQSKFCFCWIYKTTKTGHNHMWLLRVRALCYSHDCSNGDIHLIEPQAWKLTLYIYISVDETSDKKALPVCEEVLKQTQMTEKRQMLMFVKKLDFLPNRE